MRPNDIKLTKERADSMGVYLNNLAKIVHADADAHGLWDDFRSNMTAFDELPDAVRMRAVRYYATSVASGEMCELRAASDDPAHFAEEAADVIIAMLSTCVELKIDIGSEVAMKMLVNHSRPWRHIEEEK